MKDKRTILLLMIVGMTVALAGASVFAFASGAGNTPTTYPNTTAFGTNGYYSYGMMGGDWSGMMSGMMGGNLGSPYSTPTPATTTAQNSLLPLIGFATLIGAALTGTGGVAYFFASRTKITLAQQQHKVSTIVNAPLGNVVTPYDSVSKTLTADERKVVDVLTSHDGEYLQKYIRSETGLSRLKVHRIVARLAERGIVTLESSGNTNKVHLSSWLIKQPFQINSKKNAEKMVIEA